MALVGGRILQNIIPGKMDTLVQQGPPGSQDISQVTASQRYSYLGPATLQVSLLYSVWTENLHCLCHLAYLVTFWFCIYDLPLTY